MFRKRKRRSKFLISFLSFLLVLSPAFSGLASAAGKEQKATTFTSKKDKKLKTADLQKNQLNKALQKRVVTSAQQAASVSMDTRSKVRKSNVAGKKSTVTSQSINKKNTVTKASSVSKRSTFSSKKTQSYAPDELIIKFKDTVSAAAVQQKHSLKTTKKLNSIGAEVVKIQSGESVDSLISTLKSDPSVVFVQPNYKYLPSDIPNDPMFNQMWGLHNTGQSVNNGPFGVTNMDIDYPDAISEFNKITNPGQVVVGVIDTGVDINHPDLKDHIWTNPGEIPNNGIDDDHDGYVDDVNGWDFYNYDNTVFDPQDGDDHGTHVSGTIAASANNGVGVTGIAPNVKIMPIKFIGPSGGLTSDAISAIDYAKSQGVKIVNTSWTGTGYDQALKDAIDNSGMLFVAAAGNDSLNTDQQPEYPASFDSQNILSVAAMDNMGNLASFSNYGYNSVDIAAPGVDILSTVPKKVQEGAAAEINNTSLHYKAIFNGFGFENMVSTDRQNAFNKAMNYLGATPTSKILLVQDDESDIGAPNYLSDYQTMLSNAGLTYSVKTIGSSDNGPDLTSLNSYDVVIWFTGASSGQIDPNLTSTDISTLDQFLNQGNKSLLLSGQDILFRNESTGFVNSTLSISINGEGDTRNVQGVTGTIYDGAQYQISYAPYADYITSNDTNVAKVDLVYPADQNYDNAYAYYSGTSMATPHVTGVAALLAGKNINIDPLTLKNTILASGDVEPSLSGVVQSGKKLNAYNALTYDPAILDNDVPGVPFSGDSVTGTLDSSNDTDDVYAVNLNAGETIKANLTGDAGTDFDLYLFDPYTNTVNNSANMLAHSENAGTSTESIEFIAPYTGIYYIDAYAYAGAGSYQLSVTTGNGVGSYEDNSQAFNYYGSWNSVSNTSYSNGSIEQTNTYGDMEFSFVGNQIEWIGTKGNNQGMAEVFIDGKDMGLVSLYSDTTANQQSIFKKTIDYGKHTLQIDWTGQRDPRARKSGTTINIDKLVVSEDLTPPAQPTGVNVLYDGTAPAVFWDYSDAPNGYNIYRKDTGTDTYTLLNNSLVKGNGYFEDSTAVPGKSYDYAVTAVSLIGTNTVESVKSAPVTYIYDDQIPGVQMNSTSVTGNVDANGDYVDTWAVNLQAGKTYSFSFNGPQGTDFDYRLYDTTAKDIYQDTPLRVLDGSGSEEYVSYAVTKTGTYYIAVDAYSGAGQYSINMTSKPTVQDDDISMAAPLGTATSVSDFLDSYDHDDVYSVDLAKGDSITLNLSSTATNGSDFDLYLYGPNSTTVDYTAANYVPEIAYSNQSGTSSEAITYTAETAGKYYIDVNDNIGSGPYILNVAYNRTNQNTTNTIEETDSQITYSGSWSTVTNSNLSGGSAKVNNTAGASAQLTFNGSGIKVLAYTNFNRGKADIYIDGTLSKTVDLYSSSSAFKVPIFENNNLVNGTHTIKIVNKGEKSSSSSGIYISLDALVITVPVVQTSTVEENNSKVIYNGTWTTVSNSNHSGGFATVNNSAGSSAQLTFNGSGIKVLAYTNFNRGKADIYIDGNLSKTVDLYSSTSGFQVPIFEINNLINGTHTIKIVNKGEKSSSSSGIYISLDAFKITS